MTSEFPETTVESVREFVEQVTTDTKCWDCSSGCTPWFRGQSNGDYPPLPSILRPNTGIHEHTITARFRNQAPMFGPTPARDKKDEWLYFMQHVGIPTRLLDWTQGALIGLYFAVHGAAPDANPAVWVIHPLKLNCETIGETIFPDAEHTSFMRRCDLAYGPVPGVARKDIDLPIAILPTLVHPRMRAQKGCFTLHGTNGASFEAMASKTALGKQKLFLKYRIPFDSCEPILRDLRLLGVTHCALFPDHDGLAIEMKRVFQSSGLASDCNVDTG